MKKYNCKYGLVCSNPYCDPAICCVEEDYEGQCYDIYNVYLEGTVSSKYDSNDNDEYNTNI